MMDMASEQDPIARAKALLVELRIGPISTQEIHDTVDALVAEAERLREERDEQRASRDRAVEYGAALREANSDLSAEAMRLGNQAFDALDRIRALEAELSGRDERLRALRADREVLEAENAELRERLKAAAEDAI